MTTQFQADGARSRHLTGYLSSGTVTLVLGILFLAAVAGLAAFIALTFAIG
jgi:hypothetical protein